MARKQRYEQDVAEDVVDPAEEMPSDEGTGQPINYEPTRNAENVKNTTNPEADKEYVRQGYHAYTLRSDDAIVARAEKVSGDTELTLHAGVGQWTDGETDTTWTKGESQTVDEDTAKRLLRLTDSHGNPRFKVVQPDS